MRIIKNLSRLGSERLSLSEISEIATNLFKDIINISEMAVSSLRTFINSNIPNNYESKFDNAKCTENEIVLRVKFTSEKDAGIPCVVLCIRKRKPSISMCVF